jgi:hypothetical protein
VYHAEQQEKVAKAIQPRKEAVFGSLLFFANKVVFILLKALWRESEIRATRLLFIGRIDRNPKAVPIGIQTNMKAHG